MELDDLQSIWKKGHQNLSIQQVHSPQEIQELLSKKTKGILSNINKSIFIEVILMLLVCFYSIFAFYSIDKRFSAMMFGLMLISLGHYYIKYRLLNYTSSNNLKNSLQRIIKITGRYLYVYQGSVWVTLAILGWGGGSILSEKNWSWWFTGIIVGGIGVFFYLVFQWYLDLLYGRELKALQQCLYELEREEG
ncbi:MAG: hypothetical protein EAZ06_07235 [Cytophagales bacterium]|nr:MAG: hypothetical protein EAY69_06045 [Cytophagales bacterium]TAH29301.1 MAG: hypothetical protein EAZ06_07235 [Cytophagales bacterium]